MEPDASLKPVRLARLDGALGAGERIEYEIPYNPTGEQNVVKYNLTLNDLVPGEEMTEDVEVIRCDGHQHMGMPIFISCRAWYSRRTGVVAP
jgi:hypothetical protein